MTRQFATATGLSLLLALTACSGAEPAEPDSHANGETAEPQKGPNGGRLLESGDFALELTIFEDGQEPQFRLFSTRNGKPVDPKTVDARVTLKRLGGEVDSFAFKPEGAFLAGQGVVEEPHSFDVEVVATEGGRTHRWSYASPEGRTHITADAARASGIEVEKAGSATVGEVRELIGTVQLDPSARSDVRARFPGKVMAVSAQVGDRVRPGQLLARVESNESLQVYSVTAPVGGVIAQRNTNVGDVAGEAPLFVITDPARTTVVFNIFPRDLETIRPGQTVEVETMDGVPVGRGRLSDYLPEGNVQAGTALMRTQLTNPTGQWRPGMALRGKVLAQAAEVPLAVRTEAIQRFRDFNVVFARFGEDYEVRMLELGRQTPEWTEVKSGIALGTPYVTKGAFLVRADIEKSGASHDH
jgi:cobalt-zinc-cadmium efflux system membrane fusion protein